MMVSLRNTAVYPAAHVSPARFDFNNIVDFFPLFFGIFLFPEIIREFRIIEILCAVVHNTVVHTEFDSVGIYMSHKAETGCCSTVLRVVVVLNDGIAVKASICTGNTTDLRFTAYRSGKAVVSDIANTVIPALIDHFCTDNASNRHRSFYNSRNGIVFNSHAECIWSGFRGISHTYNSADCSITLNSSCKYTVCYYKFSY